MNSSKQIKLGALISYFAIAFNIVAGLIYTPWMISKIGQSNYGLYTLATSVISMFVMDFGMGAAVTRFLSRYNAMGDKKAVNDFLGLIYKLYLAIDAVIFAVLICVYFFVDKIYANLTPDELSVFKVLYIIVASFSVISFPFTNLNGILTAYEKFVPLKACDLFNKVFIIVGMVIALHFGYGVYALVTVNAVAGLIIMLIIINRGTDIKINWKYFDKDSLKDIFGFSVWTTVSSIAQRLIFNITPSIITAVSVTGSVGVAVFGLATRVEGYVYTFSTAINGMFMPRISRIISDGKREEELMPLMIRIGRIQIMIVGLLTVGFISLGKSFIIDIWNKPDFAQSYICAVLLIIPSLFFLPLQIGNTTLIVENKVRLEAMVLLATGAVNIVLSLVLSKYYAAVGASVSIFIAYMLRNVLICRIFKKHLKLNMAEFFKKSYLKLLPYLAITMVIGLLAEHFNPLAHGYLRFLINGIIVVAVFFVLMLCFGMNDYEKSLLFGTLKKIFGRLKRA